MSNPITKIRTMPDGAMVPLKLVTNNCDSVNDQFFEKWRDKRVNIIVTRNYIDERRGSVRKNLALLMSCLGFIPECDMVAIVSVASEQVKGDIVERLCSGNDQTQVLFDETGTYETALSSTFFAIRTDSMLNSVLSRFDDDESSSLSSLLASSLVTPIYTGPHELLDRELLANVFEFRLRVAYTKALTSISLTQSLLPTFQPRFHQTQDADKNKLQALALLSMGTVGKELPDYSLLVEQAMQDIPYPVGAQSRWFSLDSHRKEAITSLINLMDAYHNPVVECPPIIEDAVHDAQQQVKDANAVSAIWNYALSKTPFSLSSGTRDEYDEEIVSRFAELLGVDYMLDSYFKGVPLEDIVGTPERTW